MFNCADGSRLGKTRYRRLGAEGRRCMFVTKTGEFFLFSWSSEVASLSGAE